MKRAMNLSLRYGVIAIAFVSALIFSSAPARGAAWNGIEPLKTRRDEVVKLLGAPIGESPDGVMRFKVMRSEEHTSELQSQSNLVCRLLLEKKKKNILTAGPPSIISHRLC